MYWLSGKYIVPMVYCQFRTARLKVLLCTYTVLNVYHFMLRQDDWIKISLIRQLKIQAVSCTNHYHQTWLSHTWLHLSYHNYLLNHIFFLPFGVEAFQPLHPRPVPSHYATTSPCCQEKAQYTWWRSWLRTSEIMLYVF